MSKSEIDERDLFNICLNQHAVVTADGYPNVNLPARLTALMPAMGRRQVLSGDAAEKSDKDVREVLLSFEQSSPRWPIGLRVVVRFKKCGEPADGIGHPLIGQK